MTNNHMRLLTEQELQSIYEGNIFTSIWNRIKKHLLYPTFNLYTRFKNTDTGIENVYGSSDIWSDDLLKRRKGHVYKTIVVDLKSGRILYVGQGKAADALAGFWKRVRRKKLDIKYIATDLSASERYGCSPINKQPKRSCSIG